MRVFYKILLFACGAAFIPLVTIALLSKAFETEYVKNKALDVVGIRSSELSQIKIPSQEYVRLMFQLPEGNIVSGPNNFGIKNVYDSRVLVRERFNPAGVFAKLQSEEAFLLGGCKALSASLGECVFVPRSLVSDGTIRLVNALFVVLILIGVLLVAGIFWVTGQIVRPIEALTGYLAKKREKPKDYSFDFPKASDDEFGMLVEQLGDYFRELSDYQKTEIQTEKEQAIAELALRVAHDIRSPLQALRMCLETLDIPREPKAISDSAMIRINEIANELLRASRQPKASDIAIGPVWVAGALDSILEEKRLKLGEQTRIQFRTFYQEQSELSVVKANECQLKSILSNLLDNSIESIDDSGEIKIQFERREQTLNLTLRDTGRGIPEAILKQLPKKGLSFGKKSGTGIGLYQAEKMLRAWGGDLQIESQAGEGTAVRISFPLSDAASSH